MKWLSVFSDSRQKIFELKASKDKLLTLTYHPLSNTIRISANDEKRVFLIGRKGFRKKQTVLQNEYGIRMGQLINEGGQDERGNIDVYEDHYNYLLHDSAKATIYKNEDLFAECELPRISKSDNHDLLMLALCWYMTTSVRNHVEMYA
jgi:hypothetical protein